MPYAILRFQKRKEFVEELNGIISEIHSKISGGDALLGNTRPHPEHDG